MVHTAFSAPCDELSGHAVVPPQIIKIEASPMPFIVDAVAPSVVELPVVRFPEAEVVPLVGLELQLGDRLLQLIVQAVLLGVSPHLIVLVAYAVDLRVAHGRGSAAVDAVVVERLLTTDRLLYSLITGS